MSSRSKCRFARPEHSRFNSSFKKKKRWAVGGGVNLSSHYLTSAIVQGQLSQEAILLQFKEKHGDNVIIDESTYIMADKKAKFIDKEYGEWWAFVFAVIRGSGHPKRGTKMRSDKLRLSMEK